MGTIVLPKNYLVSWLVEFCFYGPYAKDFVVYDIICLLPLAGFNKVLILFTEDLTSLFVGYCCIDAAFYLFGRGGTCPALTPPFATLLFPLIVAFVSF